jgi:membrane peptidoglycan carboxypeptidase
MVDMATAFGVLANQGARVDLNPILHIIDYQGETVEQLDPQPIPVVSSSVTYIISDIISDNAARIPAFGPHSALEIPGYRVAVKTGTTDNKKDNWTIGYTPEYLVVVWVGNNDNTPMNQQLTSGITGAAPIWNRVMNYILRSYSKKNTWYNVPPNVVARPCGGRTEYYIAGTEGNARYCGVGSVSPTAIPAH